MELNVTDVAIEKMKFFLQDKDLDAWAVRIVAKTKSDFAFSLTEMAYVQSTDNTIEKGGVKVIVDEISAKSLEGADVDFIDSDLGSGFKVTAKEAEPQPQADLPPLDLSDPIVKKVNDVLINEINPAIASHGGVANLLGVKENRAYVKLGGGCQGCASSLATLKQGIEVKIKEMVPEILEVVDQTDHAAGENPYFQ
jgi:Fe/S biogenesis protein NfuA